MRYLVAAIPLLVILNCMRCYSAISCLACNRIAYPRGCTRVIHCADQESSCYTEKIETPDGIVYYNIGCRNNQHCPVTARTNPEFNHQISVRSSENRTCHECCNTSLCNSGGCSSAGFPPPDQRGPVCYHCNTMGSDVSCNTIRICSRDQLCDVLSHGIGKRTNSKRNICFRCCNGDLCNLGCNTQ